MERYIELEWGNSYIINENELIKSLNVFENIIKLGIPGLCITRTHPDKLNKKKIFKNVDLKWLSKDSGDLCIPPLPEKISHDISNFFRENPNSVLLLGGLEYIKTNNDLTRLIKFIDHIKDLVIMYKSAFIMPVFYDIFDDDEIALLRKNMIDITNLEPNFEALKH